MPTYQYSCRDCGHFFEQFQSFSDDALTVCPACEGRLRKVFNAVGVVFKGSGFYRTDNRAESRSGAAGSDRGGEKREPAAGTGDSGSGTGASSDGGGTGAAKPASASSGSPTRESAA